MANEVTEGILRNISNAIPETMAALCTRSSNGELAQEQLDGFIGKPYLGRIVSQEDLPSVEDTCWASLTNINLERMLDQYVEGFSSIDARVMFAFSPEFFGANRDRTQATLLIMNAHQVIANNVAQNPGLSVDIHKVALEINRQNEAGASQVDMNAAYRAGLYINPTGQSVISSSRTGNAEPVTDESMALTGLLLQMRRADPIEQVSANIAKEQFDTILQDDTTPLAEALVAGRQIAAFANVEVAAANDNSANLTGLPTGLRSAAGGGRGGND